jgi:hypothetical protein
MEITTSHRLVVVSNPTSRNARNAAAMIDDLRDAFPRNNLLELESQPRLSDHREMLGETLQEGDIVAAAGGDGLVGATMCVLADRQVTPGIRIPIGVLPCGYVNDLSAVLSARRFKRPADVFTRGRTISMRPLQAKIETSHGDSRTFVAAGYIGVNATPIGAEYVNARRGSNIPGFVLNARTVWHVLRHAVPAEVDHRLTPKGLSTWHQKERIRELVVPNIPIMAGEAKFREVSSNDKGIYAYTITDTIPLWRGLLQLRAGRAPHHYYGRGDLTFIPSDDLLLQFDGETVQDGHRTFAPAGSCVTISRMAPHNLCFPLAAIPAQHQPGRWPAHYNE